MSEKKYLISDKNDDLIIYLKDIIKFYAVPKNFIDSIDSIKQNKTIQSREDYLLNEIDKYKEGYILPFSSIIDLPFISIYDDELLLKKFPNGFVTENLILIPSSNIEYILNSSEVKRGISKDNLYLINKILNNNMIAFVENILNIEFTDEEKNTIKNDLTKNFDPLNKDDDIIDFVEPEKITNQKLLKLINNKNYSIEDRLKSFISIESDVQEGLEKNKENFNLLPTLLKKLSNIKKSHINIDITLEEFEEIVESARYREISPTIPLKIVMSQLDKEINKCNNDMKEFSENITDYLLHLIVGLDDLQFNLVLSNIEKQIKITKDKEIKELIEKNKKENKKINEHEIFSVKEEDPKLVIAFKLANHYNITENKAEIIKTAMSGFDKLSSNINSLVKRRKP